MLPKQITHESPLDVATKVFLQVQQQNDDVDGHMFGNSILWIKQIVKQNDFGSDAGELFHFADHKFMGSPQTHHSVVDFR